MRAYETTQNYASAFIRSDILRRNNSRYLEYCELRRTCLHKNNMQECVVYSFPFLSLIVVDSYFYCTTITAHAYFVELEKLFRTVA